MTSPNPSTWRPHVLFALGFVVVAGSGCEFLLATACNDDADCVGAADGPVCGPRLICGPDLDGGQPFDGGAPPDGGDGDPDAGLPDDGGVSVDGGPQPDPDAVTDLTPSYAGTLNRLNLSFTAPAAGGVQRYELVSADILLDEAGFVAEQTLSTGLVDPGLLQTWDDLAFPWYGPDQILHVRAVFVDQRTGPIATVTARADAFLQPVADIDLGTRSVPAGETGMEVLSLSLDEGALVHLNLAVTSHGDASQFDVADQVIVPPTGADLSVTYLPTAKGAHEAAIAFIPAQGGDTELFLVRGTGANNAPTVTSGIVDYFDGTVVNVPIGDPDGLAPNFTAQFVPHDGGAPIAMTVDDANQVAALPWTAGSDPVYGVVEVDDGLDVGRGWLAVKPTDVILVDQDNGDAALDDEQANVSAGNWLEVGPDPITLFGGSFLPGVVVYSANLNNPARLSCPPGGDGIAIPSDLVLIGVELSGCEHALRLDEGARIISLGNTYFDNHAPDSGAAILGTDAEVFSIGDTFTNNTAGSVGAAITSGYQADSSTVRIHLGTFTNNTGGTAPGGAVTVIDGDSLSVLEIFDSTFVGSEAISGGALGAIGTSFRLERTSFQNNSATLNGGAIQLSANVAQETVIIEDCQFLSNAIVDSVDAGQGAALRVSGLVDLEVRRTTFSNHNVLGGAAASSSVLQVRYGAQGYARIEGSRFVNNGPAVAGDDVVIRFESIETSSTFTLDLEDTVLVDNTALPVWHQAGGGTSLELKTVEISGNTADGRASAGVVATSDGVVNPVPSTSMTNVLITQNTLSNAPSDGAAAVVVTIGDLSASLCTVADNVANGAAEVGGIRSTSLSDELTLQACIVRGNDAVGTGNLIARQVGVANAGNIFDSLIANDGVDDLSAGIGLTDSANDDPLFGPDYRLPFSTSPGIDFSSLDVSLDPALFSIHSATDQRRADEGRIDVGYHWPTEATP